MSTTEPIRNKPEIQALAEYYLKKGQFRNYVLIVLGIHTALRISDLLELRWEDVYDFRRKNVRKHIVLSEKKTKKHRVIALNRNVCDALKSFAKNTARPGAYLIENPRTRKAISRIQAYRLIRSAAEALVLKNRVSCHSLRKTLGYHAWKKGVSPALIMEIYNHSSLSITRRYLGITQDEKDEVYLELSLLS